MKIQWTWTLRLKTAWVILKIAALAACLFLAGYNVYKQEFTGFAAWLALSIALLNNVRYWFYMEEMLVQGKAMYDRMPEDWKKEMESKD